MKQLRRSLTVSVAILSVAGLAVAQNQTAYSQGGAAAAPPLAPLQLSTQNPLYGSVPTGTATGDVISLSLSSSLDRGLKQNLGLLSGNDSVLASQGHFGQARSYLLPSISAYVSETDQQIDLDTFGFRFPGFPTVIGPFNYFDARASVNQSVVDLNLLRTERAAAGNLTAEKLTLQDTREVVVLAITNAYLQTIASQSRVQTAQAQADTAKALFDQATDQKNSGVAAGIDLLRAQVELQTQQQQLIAAQNDFSKQKLALARMIGLPLAQQFTLSDSAPYEPSAAVSLDDALKTAYTTRADFQSAQARVHASESSLGAAAAEHLPSLDVHADYGVVGVNPSQSHGTFTTSGELHIPIFAGNRANEDAVVARADLERSHQQLDDLRALIEQEIRTATLDLQSASDQVKVATSSVGLAQQTLVQARDRFRNGVTDNIEVVQAQQAVAQTNESYISSLYAYNLARVQLARAMGSAERSVREYWKEK